MQPNLSIRASQLAIPLRAALSAVAPLAGNGVVRDLRTVLAAFGPLDGPILILGERGVGKQACAEALHHHGGRPGSLRILDSDAAELASPRELLDRVEHESGPTTLYLADIERIHPILQPEMAAVLRRPHGVRIVCGAHPTLAELTELGRFDRELHSVVARTTLHVPALRDRLDDIAAIAAALLPRPLSSTALAVLTGYGWPGNVTELRDVLQRCHRAHPDGPITAEALRRVLGNRAKRLRGFDIVPLRDLEHSYLVRVLARFHGNCSHAARHLGISRNTLARKLRAGRSGATGPGSRRRGRG
jgi:sigma-54 dependent transcriptional regulator, acetoin dehydrogenase operon transcriptional activator AcoR